MATKPITVHAASPHSTDRQREGLDRLVGYLAKSLVPGVLLPPTARIVIEWGDEDVLTTLRATDD